MDLNRHGDSGTCRLNYAGPHGEMPYLTFDILEETGIVAHFFSTREGGMSSGHLASLNFSYSQGDIRENVDENFRRAAALLGKTPADIVCSSQIRRAHV